MIGITISNIITPAVLNAEQIDNTAVANNSISTAKIQDDAVTQDKLANDIDVSHLINDAGYISDLTGFTTDDVTEGSNLYYTDTRVATWFSTTGLGLLSTDVISEGTTNLYHTDARAIAAVEGEPTLDLSGQVTVTGNTADKTTTIGDFDVLGLYDSTGIQVEADETSWAGISLVEYEGGASKPVSGFANPFFSSEVWGGSPGSETAVSSGKRLLAISGTGAEDTGSGIVMPTSSPARMIMETTEQHSGGGRGTRMYIQTTPVGSSVRSTTADFRGDSTILIDLFASGTVVLSNLPTSDPSNPGQLWNDGGTLKVS